MCVAKVMLVHAGGYSQRLASVSAVGKVFMNLPCGEWSTCHCVWCGVCVECVWCGVCVVTVVGELVCINKFVGLRKKKPTL